MIQLSLDHAHGIGVSPKLAFWIKSIVHPPIDCKIFSSANPHILNILCWVPLNRVLLNFKFNQFIQILWGESDGHDGLLIRTLVVEGDCVLLKVVAILENYVLGVQDGVGMGLLRHIWTFILSS